MPNKSTTITQYRCEKCNAPYPLGADDVIATCPYCGYTFEIGGSEIKHFLVPNKLDQKSVISCVKKWFESAASKTVGRGVIKDMEIETPILQWIPTFRVEGGYTSHHFGYKKKGSGGDTRYIRIEDSDTGHMVEWIVARRHAATFGIDEFILAIEDSSSQKFSIDKTNDSPVLNSEITDMDVPRRAQKARKDRERQELLPKVDKLLDHQLDISPESITYTHVPYWLIRYSYQKGTFRVAVSGATGNILVGELPVTKWYRAKKWFTSVFLLIGSALLFQVLPYILMALFQGNSSNGDVWVIPIAIAAIAGILWIGSITILRGALQYEIEVDKDGKERKDRFSLTGTLKSIGGD